MDYTDLWQATVVPSITSQTTFSNDTMVLSTKTLNEQESKRDFSLPFDGNEKKKIIYRNAERSKITSLPPICQKLSHNYSHCSFKSDMPISTLHGNKEESHDRTKDKINKEDIHSQICKDMNNASAASFIELGVVYKILDFIKDYDFKVSLLTDNCCNKISRTLQCSLAQHRKKLEDLLSNDSSLHRCEHCGISCILGSHRTIKNIKSHRIHPRHNDETAEHDCNNNDQNNEKSEISINPSNLINKVQSKIKDAKINHRTDNKDQLSKLKLLPNKERAFIMKKYIESLNEANNISVTKTNINATIKNKFFPDNNIKKLFTDLEIEKMNKRYESNSAAQNNFNKYESLNEIRVYANIDKEKVVRKISYEPKLHSNNLLAKDQFSNIVQKIKASQLLDKHSDIYPVIDNVKHLAHGQFMELDKKENELLSKLQERRYIPNDARNGQNSVLYGSREDYSQHDTGFWLFDESKHLSQIASDEYRYLPMLRLDNNRENISFSANNSRYSHTVEKITDNWSNYIERDSLEDCALLEQTRKSNATIFSSSSVNNLIYGSLDRKYEINNIDDEDIPQGHKLVSSKPSLDIARHFRAQIAKDRNSGNAKDSIDELHTHDSNILVRLSSETRRKIYRLIKTIISSDKDQTFFHKKYLMNDVLKSAKLLHSKSMDAAFAHSNKIDNEIINICADDCIPIKLSNLEDKNHLLKRQDNFVNICNQELNKSKDFIKICHEKTSASADNSTKKIIRQIIYKDELLKNVRNNNDTHEYMITEILPIYCKILENCKDMDWENFRKFVEVLHPDEKESWHNVCEIISKEAERMSGDTEIYIEISPVNLKKKTGEIITCKREIVFELDMTLKNMENFLNKKFVEKCLDTPKNAEDITD